jgi:hypothetical protein
MGWQTESTNIGRKWEVPMQRVNPISHLDCYQSDTEARDCYDLVTEAKSSFKPVQSLKYWEPAIR